MELVSLVDSQQHFASETMSGNGAGDGGKTGWSVAPTIKPIESHYGGVVPECFAATIADADRLFGEGGATKVAGVVLQLVMNVHGMVGFPMRLLDGMVVLRDPGEGDGGKNTW